MAITALMPEGRQRYFNNDGTVAAGCLLYTYAAGTTTPKATYSDYNGATPNANPIQLDAKGEAVIYWAGAYKVDLKTAAGVQITGYPVDNINTDPAGIWTIYATLLASAGSSLIGFIAAGTGAVLRTVQARLREWPSPLDYGCVGDGSTDDGPNFQKALDAEKTLFIPAGYTFLTQQTLLLNDYNRITGASKAKSIIKAGASIGAGNNVIRAVSKTQVEVDNISILGTVGNLPLSGIQLQTCTYSSVHDCYIQYASHEGVSLNTTCDRCDVYSNTIRDISSSIGWGIGLFFEITRCKIYDNSIYDCGAYGIVLDDGTTAQVGTVACSRNVVTDNLIYTATTAMWGIAIEGSTDNIVSDNHISVISTVGIDIAEGNSATTLQSQRNQVHDNIIRMDSSLVTTGIRVYGGANNNSIIGNEITAGDIGINFTNGAVVATPQGNVVKGNEIFGCAAGAATNMTSILIGNSYLSGLEVSDNYVHSSGKFGIDFQIGTNVTIKNNRIQNTQRDGIRALTTGGAVVDLCIIGNEVTNAGLAAAATYDCITVGYTGAGTIVGCVISHNVFNDIQGTPTTRAGLSLTGAGAGFGRTQVFGNRTISPSIIQPITYLNPDTIYGDTYPQAFTGGAVTMSYVEDDSLVQISATSAVVVSNVSHCREGNKVTFVITQGGAGGYAVTWGAQYKVTWSDTGNAVGAKSAITFIFSGGSFVQMGAQAPYV